MDSVGLSKMTVRTPRVSARHSRGVIRRSGRSSEERAAAGRLRRGAPRARLAGDRPGRKRMHRKLLACCAVAVVVCAVVAAPAGAASDGSLRNDRRISISGGVTIASGEVVDGPVVSVDGPVTINGTVKDDVYV